jgi:hypothetical protein
LKFHRVQILFKQEEASANASGRVRKAPLGIFCDTCLMYLKDEATRIAIAGLLIVVQSPINCLIVFGALAPAIQTTNLQKDPCGWQIVRPSLPEYL